MVKGNLVEVRYDIEHSSVRLAYTDEFERCSPELQVALEALFDLQVDWIIRTESDLQEIEDMACAPKAQA